MDPRFFGGPGLESSSYPNETTEDVNVNIDVDGDLYDFAEASTSSRFPSLEESPDFKYYFLDVLKKDGKISRTVPIKIAKREVCKMYEKISKMVFMEMGGFDVIYEVRRQSGKKQKQRLQYHPDADIMGEGCELLFCQVRSDCHLSIQRVTKPEEVKKVHRKKKNSESAFAKFKKLMGTENRKAYQLVAENPEVLSNFLSKLSFMRVLLNDVECNNWLSPAHFYCPVQRCTVKVITMNSFNAVHNLQKHLINHDLSKNKMCSILIDRMKFLDKDDWFEQTHHRGLAWMIETLEGMPNLSLRVHDVVTVHCGGEFKGRSKCMDPSILEEFQCNNYSSIKKIKDGATIASFFNQEAEEEKESNDDDDDDDNSNNSSSSSSSSGEEAEEEGEVTVSRNNTSEGK